MSAAFQPKRRALCGAAALGLAAASLDALAQALNEAERAAPPETAAPPPADRLNGLLAQERSLWLLRGDEEVRTTWWTAARGENRDEYLRLCWILRDVQAQRVMPIDRRLLDVLAGIQTWLAGNGKRLPMLVHSGYRSLRTNRATEGAARDSQHLTGRAADISVPGVSNLKIAGLASVLGVGGTGFYVGRSWVHVDNGPDRLWIDQGRRKPAA